MTKHIITGLNKHYGGEKQCHEMLGGTVPARN